MGKDLEKKTKLKVAIFFRITTIVSLIYIIWRIFFTIPTGYGIVSFICGIILVVCEAIGIFEEYEHYVSVAKKLVPTKPELKPEDYPDVDVFIATHNESTDLLYKTVNGCTYMEYPDKSKVHIYICDDANRPEMKALAEQLGVGYFGLENNKDAKAGNLNNAMRLTSSKLIATFDADMIPRRDFLMATVPYFFRDEKVGFIQTPQSFYNPDLFHKYQKEEFSKPTSKSISSTIRSYKSAVTKRIHENSELSDKYTIWQPRYYDNVIRNEKAYQKIWEYIDTNVSRWKEDKFFSE